MASRFLLYCAVHNGFIEKATTFGDTAVVVINQILNIIITIITIIITTASGADLHVFVTYAVAVAEEQYE